MTPPPQPAPQPPGALPTGLPTGLAAGLPAGRVDLLVAGAGVVGLAHAVEAHLRGLSVAVVERDAFAAGASVRNFGHICTTAQDGPALGYALAARDRWLRLAAETGLAVAESGTLVVARRPEEMAVLEEFAADRGPDQVRLLDAAGVARHLPAPGAAPLGGALLPLDLRLDPRAAIPALAAWLAGRGVPIAWRTSVLSAEPGLVRTSRGDVRADRTVLAVGHDLDRLHPAAADAAGMTRCRLQMLEVAAPGGLRVAPGVLTGLSLLRYSGFAAQPSAAALRDAVTAASPELLDAGVNLMFTQRPDGAIVLGDTHHYAATHTPFDDEDTAELLLREGARLLGVPGLRVLRRWRGEYASSDRTDFLDAEVASGVRAVSVTSGIGMTTAHGLAQAVLDSLL
ncbi:TIGR03364 family FAD-dependent oxidoreductase [Actinomadura parmotrematis]|uniref:TIGR03364 family FAD-dependent oxidoreductase n=1 Tax=Actinomadura parmotrematis TaxID=2864039 RepID=A0ABS7FQQ5_9ACTN|nr:TIGR03364 family FAD-dependent oxidoreductase [Actinomadura parmotrematis]MBW8482732.1 TIGR03364 family FAD-dependent oxidoreductase [Actinomadura parmotrematis]